MRYACDADIFVLLSYTRIPFCERIRKTEEQRQCQAKLKTRHLIARFFSLAVISRCVVGEEGLEPSIRKEHDFESCAYTNSATLPRHGLRACLVSADQSLIAKSFGLALYRSSQFCQNLHNACFDKIVKDQTTEVLYNELNAYLKFVKRG